MEIRVMVASEVRLYREGLQRVLQGITGIVLVGIAATAEEVYAQAASLIPSVILLDVAMARSLAAAKLLARRPLDGALVILGIPESGGQVIGSLPPNLLGYVARDGTVTDLITAIHHADRGELYCSQSLVPYLAQRVRGAKPRARQVDGVAQLTAREMEILELLREGCSNKAISRQLGIGLSTVKNHVHSVLAKLGVHCRSEAIAVLYWHEGAGRARAHAPSTIAEHETAIA